MIVHWHRADLRGPDNRGLSVAAGRGSIVPVFVLDPEILSHAGPPRVAGLREALRSLREWYRDRGSDLLLTDGDPCDVLPAVADEFGAEAVVWNRGYSGLARVRDRAVVAALEDERVEHVAVDDAHCHEPGSIAPERGEHYSVFSYFWKKWRDREKDDPEPAPDSDTLARGEDIRSSSIGRESIPSAADLGFDDPSASTPAVGRDRAVARLESFCNGPIYRYAEDRDRPDAEATSRLSVHLKWGTIGVRETYAATGRARRCADGDADRDSVDEFRRQLAWREFYAHVLRYNPEMVSTNLADHAGAIEWRNDPAELAAWKAGETGYPIVDAGMRQLRAEAWVHNRVRMIVASFCTKDLLIDWRRGYDWYRERLADHETANDVGGWQWAASTGADAQPYFRVFNPTTQGERFDPDGEYVRRYVPELRDVDPTDIHRWCELSPERREELAPAYPGPIVDHAERRELAIETFERARE
ncbi:deoxyribodipyrimidine photo-lyase [Halovivax sp.]|uniref:cryptochrome/photolyase family protein n=1 Tax=Halovivax sp. TaxID=1935978 RepID=UPI0025B99399|nr:deoxyribodipyrimidine photo-lyase [Halovivax sp.]